MCIPRYCISICLTVLPILVLGACSAETEPTSSDEAEKEEKEHIFPAQTIKLGLPMSVRVKVDGVWRNCRWSGMEYYLPECTDRLFDVSSFAKDHIGYLKEMKRHDIRRIELSVDHFPIKEVEELGMLDHFLVIVFRFEDDMWFKDVASLAKLRSLQELHLGPCHKICDLRPLRNLKQLRALTIPENSTDDSIKILQESGVLAQLRVLGALTDFREPTITDFTFLEDMKHLETLAVTSTPHVWPALPKARSLRSLSIWPYVEDTSFLLSMPRLRSLYIYCDLDNPNLNRLAKLAELETLTLSGAPVEGTDFAPLKTLTQREGLRVTLNQCYFRDYDCSSLSFARIRFHDCDFTNARFDNTVITGANFVPLIYSVIEDKMIPDHTKQNKGLTVDQIKSTWNYKNNRMNGITLPKEIATALQSRGNRGSGR